MSAQLFESGFGKGATSFTWGATVRVVVHVEEGLVRGHVGRGLYDDSKCRRLRTAGTGSGSVSVVMGIGVDVGVEVTGVIDSAQVYAFKEVHFVV